MAEARQNRPRHDSDALFRVGLHHNAIVGLVALGVSVGWSKAEPFGCVESVDSV